MNYYALGPTVNGIRSLRSSITSLLSVNLVSFVIVTNRLITPPHCSGKCQDFDGHELLCLGTNYERYSITSFIYHFVTLCQSGLIRYCHQSVDYSSPLQWEMPRF